MGTFLIIMAGLFFVILLIGLTGGIKTIMNTETINPITFPDGYNEESVNSKVVFS